MSKAICTDAIVGTKDIVARADAMVARTIDEKGADHPVAFPDTAYYLPIIYSMTGRKVERVGDLVAVMQDCHNLLPDTPSEEVWLPYLGDALDAGMAFSIEPGAYFAGEFGVRLEDVVVVTEDGARPMTEAPRELRIVE